MGKMDLKQALREKWYVQGFNAAPILIISAALSGFTMKKMAGISYSAFLFFFRDDYARMHYSAKDLADLNDTLLKNLHKDMDYFIKLKDIYDRELNRSGEFYERIKKKDIKKSREEELFGLIHESIDALDRAVGVGHVIEPYSITMDIRIKEELSGYIKEPKELNKRFALLMSPVKKSFVNEAEESLSAIAKSKEKDKMVKEHMERFGWLRNSYLGKQRITREEIIRETESLKDKEPADFRKIAKEKQEMIKELYLPKSLVTKIKATEFLTTWQDERKMHVLIAIDSVENLLEELSRRTKIGIGLLRYALKEEMDKNIANMKHELEERRKGSLYFSVPGRTEILTGKEYEEAARQLEKEKETEVKEITGMTASAGTAVGRARICTSIEAINKIKEGEILVASMTRPEYVPAMKKAAAVITDEGGITCHAAIISRELGIPCIIGTKIATKVLKEGDLIEVKGNHGLVIILRRAK